MYQFVKIKNNGISKFKHEMEAFDYYPDSYAGATKHFSELAELDKVFLDKLLSNTSYNLYVIAFSGYYKEYKESANKYKLWDSLALPNDDPDEFKFEVHFDKKLSEHFAEGKNWIVFSGIAEITSDFYVSNYLYFNRDNSVMLLLSDNVDNANLKLKAIVNSMADSKKQYDFSDLIINKLLKTDDDIIIRTDDCEEEKTIEIYTSEKCKYRNILSESN